MVEVKGTDELDRTALRLWLIDGRMILSDICNTPETEYWFEGPVLHVGPSWLSNAAGCDERRTREAALLVDFMEGAPRASVDGDQLRLDGDIRDEATELVFDLAEPAHPDWPLLDTYWGLERFRDSDEAGADLDYYGNLKFAKDGTFYGSEGCLSFDGAFRFSASELEITEVSFHDRGCEEVLDEDDPFEQRDRLREFVAPGTIEYEIVDRHLQLKRGNTELLCAPPR